MNASDGAYAPDHFTDVDCPDCGQTVEVGLNVHGVSTAKCQHCSRVFDYDPEEGVL